MNRPKKSESYIHHAEKALQGKIYSLLDPFVSLKENEVLQIQQ
jgi:hypothetical protein